MAKPPILYVIFFHPRSGSSWLSQILASNARIFHGFELLDKQDALRNKFISAAELDAFDDDIQFSIVERFAAHVQKHKEYCVAGLKVAPYQLVNSASMLARLKRRNVRLMALWRDDLLATAISQIGAKNLHAQFGEANATRPHRVGSKIRLERDELLYYLTEQKLERDRVMSIADTCDPGQILRLTYEGLYANPAATIGRISAFLGFEVDYIADVGIYKNLSRNLRDTVENLDEALDWVRGTVFERHMRVE